MCCGFPGYDTGKQLPPETAREVLWDWFKIGVRALVAMIRRGWR